MVFLNRTSKFSSLGKNWEFDEYCIDNLNKNLYRLKEIIFKCSKKLRRVKLTSKDFEEVIDSSPEGAFVFMSPPYSFGNSKEKILQYNFPFFDMDHIRLSDTLKRNAPKIKFLLTYPNDERIKKMYSWVKEITYLEEDNLFIGDRTKSLEDEIKKGGKRKK